MSAVRGWLLAISAVAALTVPLAVARAGDVASNSGSRLLLWQSNSEGDDIHIFDLQTGTLAKRLVVGPEPHGLAATSDHRTVFVTLEANEHENGQLLWIDAGSFKITRRITICPEPHALAATPDGRFLYVPCRDGHYWVVDGGTGKVLRKIRTDGRPHNTLISADGALAYLSPMYEPQAVTVVDIGGGHSVIGKIAFVDSVRPSALSSDGRWLFQHIDGLNGFQAADTRTRKVVATIEHQTPLDGILLIKSLGRLGFSGFERCHGIAIRPDQREIWSVCADTVTIHGMGGPTFPEMAAIGLPHKGYWITFSPDGRYACVALGDAGEVAVIDTTTRSIVRRLKTGDSPKRNLVLRHAS